MSYTGPGSVVTLVDEFLAHWGAVNALLGLTPLTVVLEGTTTSRTRSDLQSLRSLYHAVQAQPAGNVVLPLPAPQFPSVQTLRNNEETARQSAETHRGLVLEAIAAFNRKVRGTLAHTSFPNALPAVPGISDGNATILAAADDMISVWTAVNALPPGSLFTPPLVATVMPPGSSTPSSLTLLDATNRTNGLRTALADIVNAANGLATMRPYRDGLWDNEILPLLAAYQRKVRGEFPPEHSLVQSLPNIYPAPGHTPDPVDATGAWNPATNKADYNWSASLEPTLERYEVRLSPGPVYQDEASTTIATIPPGGPLSFSSDAGLLVSGQQAAVKIYVVLTTGNERGSNTVNITRP